MFKGKIKVTRKMCKVIIPLILIFAMIIGMSLNGFISKADSANHYVFENFEGETNIAVARGSCDISVCTTDAQNGSQSLMISGRTSTWHGASFAADEFRGNTLRASAYLKSANETTRLSIQYDIEGITSYNWINSVSTNENYWARAEGTFKVPQNAENVFVYVEASDLEDIYVDDLTISLDGAYVDPGEIVPIEYVDTTNYPVLKDLYKDYFTFGIAVTANELKADVKTKIIKEQFNSMTMGNEFKPEGILDRTTSISDLDKYNECPAVKFSGVKDMMDFAVANNFPVRGHTLVWHNQTPTWLFYEDYDTSKALASKELMLKRLENYIRQVMEWTEENYPGVIYAWDVVNEAIDDGTCTLRTSSNWYKTIGSDYMDYAFKYARKYAPAGTELFYNDYNAYQSGKQNGIINALKSIAAAGNLDGVGLQGHIGTYCSASSFTAAIQKYVDELDVVIHVTELDVTMPSSSNAEYDQGVYFKNLFSALINKKKAGCPIENVTIWGITDDLSWKADELPLMFNGDLSYKLAYVGTVSAITGIDVSKEAMEAYIAANSGGSVVPTVEPTTKAPTQKPTVAVTIAPPTDEPTQVPTDVPTIIPTTSPVITDGVEASVKISNDWGDGAVCSITFTNNTGVDFTNGWNMEFDFTRDITVVWSADLVSGEENHFVVSNPAWNTTLNDGESYTFSFMVGKGTAANTSISNVSLY